MFLLLFVLILCKSSICRDVWTEENAGKWLDMIMPQFIDVFAKAEYARFNLVTNVTDENNEKYTEASMELANFRSELIFKQKKRFDWKHFNNETLRDLFLKIGTPAMDILPEDMHSEYENGVRDVTNIFLTATVCNRPGESVSKCYDFQDLFDIMEKSNDSKELLWAWKGFRDAIGAKIKAKYLRLIPLMNEAAKLNGYNDYGELWLDWLFDQNFEEHAETALNDLKVLYEQLHAYVRRKLKDRFPTVDFPKEGHIPAHLLGHINGQKWVALENIVRPYQQKSSIETTNEMKCQGYNVTGLVVIADDFFKSMGLIPLPKAFWDYSLFEKPNDRDIICRNEAFEFNSSTDFRVEMCAEVNQPSLLNIHSLIAHVQYMMQYSHQPVIYRAFAHNGFHTAVSKIMKIYSETPSYLEQLGLLPNYVHDAEADLNLLLKRALDIIPFLPYSYVIDSYRFSLLKEKTEFYELNNKWWKMRCKYQGVSPPVDRSEQDFDASAEYLFIDNKFYFKYFSGWVLTYQMHKHLCDVSGYSGPLHQCTIYNSKKAGEKFAEFMKLGASHDIKYVMKVATGREDMSLGPLVEYFRPLLEWLQEQNEGYPVGWTDDCPRNLSS